MSSTTTFATIFFLLALCVLLASLWLGAECDRRQWRKMALESERDWLETYTAMRDAQKELAARRRRSLADELPALDDGLPPFGDQGHCDARKRDDA